MSARLGLLTLVALASLPLARADVDGDAGPPDEPPSIEVALGLVAKDAGPGAGLALLAGRPAAEVERVAASVLAGDMDGRRVIGAAVVLGADAALARPRWPVLSDRLERERGPLRLALLEAQGALGDARAIEPVLQDGQPDEVRAAARGLCRARPLRLSALLAAIDALRDRSRAAEDGDAARPDALRLTACLEALRWHARVTDDPVSLVALLGAADAEVLDALGEVRARAGREAVRDLARALVAQGDVARRATGLRLLARCQVARDEDEERVVSALADDAAAVRTAAARACWTLQLRRAMPDLARLLDDADPGVRVGALDALQRLAGQRLPGQRATWEAWLAGRRGTDAGP